MRKFGLFFAVLMLLVMIFAGAAAEAAEDEIWEMPETGVTIVVPEAFHNAKGLLFSIDNGQLGDTGVYYGNITYLCRTEEEDKAFMELFYDSIDSLGEDEILEKIASFYEPSAGLFEVFGIDGNRGLEELKEVLSEITDGEYVIDFAEELGGVGEYSYFLVGENPEESIAYLKAMDVDQSFLDEIQALYADHASFTDMFILSEPQLDEPDNSTSGMIADFKTTDLDGNPVNSLDIFARNKVTMVNLWATWCPPCVGELEELGKIAKRLQDKNCELIGICLDAEDAETIASAKQLLKDAGAEYLVLTPVAEVDEFFPAEAIPTSYFILPDGTILENPVVGAMVEQYETRIDAELQRLSE